MVDDGRQMSKRSLLLRVSKTNYANPPVASLSWYCVKRSAAAKLKKGVKAMVVVVKAERSSAA
jgi:hypothetical protein